MTKFDTAVKVGDTLIVGRASAPFTIDSWVKFMDGKLKEGDRFMEKLDVEYGRKYAKIIIVLPNQRSVYAFVEIKSGDIYKSASWKAPAKHVRGNINDPNGSWGAACGQWGIRYLR